MLTRSPNPPAPLTNRHSRTRAKRWVHMGVLIGCTCLHGWVQAQVAELSDKTASPYFYLPSADPTLDALPLKHTEVEVNIAGVMAEVTVTQTYKNEGTRPIEAQYVFPGATQAAVNAMSVRLADRLITAQIKEKAQAKLEYTQAKSEGKTAALLEQHRPNVFQMQVANILPGDDVKVQLRYTELLVPTAGQYQFVFPTVVGPRYNSPSQADSLNAQPTTASTTQWVAKPYQNAGTAPLSRFGMTVNLAAPLPLHAVHSDTHSFTIAQHDARHMSLTLDDSAKPANNRDVILNYQLAGQGVASGLMLLQGGDEGEENFFLAMVQPPKAPAPEQISPREYIFVVDVSGSMHGFPLDTTKQLLRELIGGLRPSDTFNVLLFSGSNHFLHERSLPATEANIQRAIETLSGTQSGGGTELMPALRRVYAQTKAPETARTVVVVTDGYVSVESQAFALVRQNLNHTNVFAFGIGSSVNRHLIEGLARAGMGEPFVITQPQQAQAEANRFRRMVAQPVLTQVKAQFDGVEVYDVLPERLPDVLAERPVLVLGKWRAKPGALEAGQIRISGLSPSGPFSQTLPLAQAKATQDALGNTRALRQLWARQRIAELSDQEALDGNDQLRQAITELGLRHSLMTQYTSFLAVDQQVRNPKPGNSQSVQQALPMPEGVSNFSLGAQVPSAPEPATWGAMAMCALMLGMVLRRSRNGRKNRYTS